MEDRAAELLPVPYFHVVFTLPAEISDIAYQNKAVIYDALFKASSETMLRIAADPKHLGAKIGITSVLHTWGSAMTHHPHVHMIVPGGGFSPDGTAPVSPAESRLASGKTGQPKAPQERWIATKPNFFLPVFVLSKLFRRLMLEKLTAAHAAGKLAFFGRHAHLKTVPAFTKFLAPLRRKRWFVYAKEPFPGPKAVLAYLSRYTHRVAISNSRLLKADDTGVTFRVKNYRVDGAARYTTMTLDPYEFIRRVLLHVLPKGFHRIRHTGFLASGGKADNIVRARVLLDEQPPEPAPVETTEQANIAPSRTCPCCGGVMHIIETFERGAPPRHRAEPSRIVIRIDTS